MLLLFHMLADRYDVGVSEKGKSVVDYICIPHSQLNDHRDFKVIPVTDIASAYQLPLPDKLTQMPDHSLLVTDIVIGEYIHVSTPDEVVIKRYDVKNIPSAFMNSQKVNIQHAIQRIENELLIQNNVDKAYEHFTEGRNGY